MYVNIYCVDLFPFILYCVKIGEIYEIFVLLDYFCQIIIRVYTTHFLNFWSISHYQIITVVIYKNLLFRLDIYNTLYTIRRNYIFYLNLTNCLILRILLIKYSIDQTLRVKWFVLHERFCIIVILIVCIFVFFFCTMSSKEKIRNR